MKSLAIKDYTTAPKMSKFSANGFEVVLISINRSADLRNCKQAEVRRVRAVSRKARQGSKERKAKVRL